MAKKDTAPAAKKPAKEKKDKAPKEKSSTKVTAADVELVATAKLQINKSTPNPCREGSKAYDLFESLRGMKKMQEAFDAQVDRGYLRRWVSEGHIITG